MGDDGPSREKGLRRAATNWGIDRVMPCQIMLYIHPANLNVFDMSNHIVFSLDQFECQAMQYLASF